MVLALPGATVPSYSWEKVYTRLTRFTACVGYFEESGFSQNDVNVGGRNRSALNKSGKLH